MTTPAPREIDVSALPTIEHGPSAPLFWGQILMICIEGTVFALLVAAYFYLRIGFENWPLPNEKPHDWQIPTLGLFFLLASVPPMIWAGEASKKHDRFGTFWGTVLNLVCVVAFLICRWAELVHLDFKWNTDVYGSLVWTFLGLHTMHACADGVQTLVMLAILVRKKAGEKQILGFEMDGLYWYFVVASWVPLYFLIYIYPMFSKW